MKKNILTKTVPVLTFSLVVSLLTGGYFPKVNAAASPLVEYTLENVLQSKSISDIDFTLYEASVTYPGETPDTDGIMVKADYYADDDNYDFIDTGTIMEAYESFLTETSIDKDSVTGIIIKSDNVEITEPINMEYVEVDADSVWYGSVHNTEEDTESMRKNMDPASAASKFVCIHSEYDISLDNLHEDTWNCPYVDLYGTDVYLGNSPFANASYNVIGNGDLLYLSAEDTVADFVNINFMKDSDDNTFSPTTISLDGGLFEETYKRNTEIINYIDITFDAQDGTFTEENSEIISIMENGYIPKLPEVTREGYTFCGWYTEKSGGSPVYSMETAADDIYITAFPNAATIYAHWTPNRYNVTLRLEDGTTELHENVEYDSVIDFFPVMESGDPEIVLRGWTDTDKKDSPVLQPGNLFTYAYDVILSPIWEDTHCIHGETELINVKKSTCAEEGYTGDTHCIVCDNIIEFGKIIEKTEHPGTELKNDKTATCSETGYTGDYVCTECGKVVTEGKIVAKTAHVLNSGEITKQPTKDEEGKKTYTCLECGKKIITIIPKLDVSENTDKEIVDNSNKNDILKPSNPVLNSSQTREEITKQTLVIENSIEAKKISKQKKSAKAKKAKISKVINKKGKKIQIKIKKNTGYKYQIQVCTSKKFKKGVKVYTTSKTSYTIKKLKKGKKYYVRIRTYKNINGSKIYGKWSTIKSVKIRK